MSRVGNPSSRLRQRQGIWGEFREVFVSRKPRSLLAHVAGLVGSRSPRPVGSPERPATVEEMLPSRRLFSVGKGDFKAIGFGILEELKSSCELAPHHHVLDVGCGSGRVAIPLTQYLSREGRYEGFDPVLRAIQHCQARITPSYPNFHFQVADLYNKRYNPGGQGKDSQYRFPFPDASFDLVFAVSVFTHLLPEGAERYLAETSRVVKPGGRFFATFFLLNDASMEAIRAGKSSIRFPPPSPSCSVHDPRVPETAVAYAESFVACLHERYGLDLEGPPFLGTWSGRPPSGYGGYQDALVAVRTVRP